MKKNSQTHRWLALLEASSWVLGPPDGGTQQAEVPGNVPSTRMKDKLSKVVLTCSRPSEGFEAWAVGTILEGMHRHIKKQNNPEMLFTQILQF